MHIAFHGRVASLAQNRVLELTLQTMGQIVSHHVAVTDDPRQLGPWCTTTTASSPTSSPPVM